MTATAWDNLPEMLSVSGGYVVWNVSELLALAGARAAGARIVEGIERELAAHDVGHFPTSIPRNKNASVLLYSKTQPNLGSILHQARQLTEGQMPPNTTPDELIFRVGMLLDIYRQSFDRAAKKEAAPA
ncbi:hypothetical protein ACIP9H_33940 [Streptomyces sp. NPDC088732]|uniref:hypothetical protein n=1 Tax=Streptomyces sp. NPDC088732 TaxID=3365879 RepID=UPI003830D87B